MIIMQTEDAKKRREHIEAKGLSRVIFEHDLGDSVCIQYHPRGIKGKFDTGCILVVGPALLLTGYWAASCLNLIPMYPVRKTPRQFSLASLHGTPAIQTSSVIRLA